MKQKNRYKVVVAIALVLAVTASLWFAAPAKALTVDITEPSPKTLGSNISFNVTVNIEDTELLPIQSVNLDIYNSTYRSSYYDRYADLPLGNTAGYVHYPTTGTGGDADIKATAEPKWGYGYGYRYGYGYEATEGYGYYCWGYGYGYGGYGYGYAGYGYAPTSITYNVTWHSPASWPGGVYQIEVSITADGSTFTETSSEFTLYAPYIPPSGVLPPAPPAPGVTDVSDFVTPDGVFTETVTAESFDGLAVLTIDEGTIGLTEDNEPLSEITMVEMEEPPALPENSSVIGLVYDFGPDGATFEPPITLTITYDPSAIPEGVAEGNLVIAMWDEDASEWVELSPCAVDTVTHAITAPVSRFAAFTVLAYTRPAAFIPSDLSITPAVVDVGEEVTISVLATNTGDLIGSYEVTLKMDDVVVATKEVTLIGGASQEVTFTTTKDVAGTYTVDVNGLTGEFVVRSPAVFEVSQLSIVPAEVGSGEAVTISAVVTNSGEDEGSYAITLKIDTAVEATKEVTLAAGEKTTVTFTVGREMAGTYQVEVDGLTGSFTVVKPPLAWWVWLIVGLVVAAAIGAIVWWQLRRRGG
jgi:hypothetical protein